MLSTALLGAVATTTASYAVELTTGQDSTVLSADSQKSVRALVAMTLLSGDQVNVVLAESLDSGENIGVPTINIDQIGESIRAAEDDLNSISRIAGAFFDDDIVRFVQEDLGIAIVARAWKKTAERISAQHSQAVTSLFDAYVETGEFNTMGAGNAVQATILVSTDIGDIGERGQATESGDTERREAAA